MDSSSIGS